MSAEIVERLLQSPEPWTRYRTRLDLLDQPEADAAVQADRAELLAHPQVQALVAQTAGWGDAAFKRHNDAAYPIYAFSTLADFGLRADDPGLQTGINRVLAHQSAEGAFQSRVNIPKAFGGSGEDAWTWLLCDSPTLLYALLAFGLGENNQVRRAVDHLVGAADSNGWRCVGAPELGKFKGPGGKTDPCPIVNVFALKALSLLPPYLDSAAAHAGVDVLLRHWAHEDRRLFMFGVGNDYGKLKYPYVWYNLLHVAEVLSRFPAARADDRFKAMRQALVAQANADGFYTPGSMYQSWKAWSFSDKKSPSAWLTFLVTRLERRCDGT